MRMGAACNPDPLFHPPFSPYETNSDRNLRRIRLLRPLQARTGIDVFNPGRGLRAGICPSHFGSSLLNRLGDVFYTPPRQRRLAEQVSLNVQIKTNYLYAHMPPTDICRLVIETISAEAQTGRDRRAALRDTSASM